MKKIFLILIILLIIILGCKRAKINSVGESTEQLQENETVELPEELEEEKISDILDEELDIIEISNETAANESKEPAVVLPEGTHVVELQMYNNGMQFFPKILTISLGETVRWVNHLDYHDRKAKVSVFASHNRLFRSPMLAYGEYFEHTFNETGTYYYGAVPYESWFKRGEIIVR